MESTSKEGLHQTFRYEEESDVQDVNKNFLSWIQGMLTSLEDQANPSQTCIINLENVRTGKSAYTAHTWQEVCNQLMKLLLKLCVQKIIVPSPLFDMLRGRCGNLLKTNILQTLPSSVKLCDQTFELKLFINMSRFTDKIICDNAAEMSVQKTAVEVLRNVVDKPFEGDPIATSLQIAVVRAYRFIQKLKRHKNLSRGKSKDAKDGKAPDPETMKDLKDQAEPLPVINRKQLKCYICKKRFLRRRQKTPVLKQYPRLCDTCAAMNYSKRSARIDMSGKYAVVTGGRIKIGLEIVLKLLRDGCNVIITSRFPRNAAREYSKQKDYEEWKGRLKIYPLDLKDIAGIYTFVAYVKSTFPHLDILINNAAQTLRRPMDFYRGLLDLEQIPFDHIPPAQQSVLASKASLDYGCGKSHSVPAITDHPALTIEEVDSDDSANSPAATSKRPPQALDEDTDGPPVEKRLKVECLGEDVDADKSPVLPQYKRSNSDPCSSKPQASVSSEEYELPSSKPVLKAQKSLGPLCAVLSPQVQVNSNANPFSLSRFFPRGLYDDDGQQLDLRRTNTWRSVLQSVSLGEFMEVFVVNTVAPFILNKELKPHLRKNKDTRKFIVNVSAMEGQFNRTAKNKFHPHTNMAKAALNMMTRTVALEYKECKIYMTSVDTGWVSDERPFHLAKKEERKGFRLPLDCVDGAARVLDPIITGYANAETPHYAVFLKDYNVYPW